MFNKELAAKHMEYKKLSSYPKQWIYMKEHGLTDHEAFIKEIVKVAREFDAMIEQMIAE